jgi:hypothetical protein
MGLTKYNDALQKKADNYVAKTTMPFIEELAELLDIDDDTIYDWIDLKSKRYKEAMSVTYKKLFRKQKLALVKDGLAKTKGQVFNIFLLKANHGFVETEKKQIEGNINYTVIDSV